MFRKTLMLAFHVEIHGKGDVISEIVTTNVLKEINTTKAYLPMFYQYIQNFILQNY